MRKKRTKGYRKTLHNIACMLQSLVGRKIRQVAFVLFLACLVGGFGNHTLEAKNQKEVAKKEQKNTEQPPASDKTDVQKTAEQEKAEKIAKVRDNKADYPEEFQDLLTKNEEALDFILDYPKKHSAAYAETIGDIIPGEIPLLIQWDEKWGYAPYGTSTIAVSGCGPTCLAMVVSGLTGNNKITPYVVAQYSMQMGYLDEENRSLWELMIKGPSNWGVKSKEVGLDEESVKKELEAGRPIICSVKKGDFTSGGHFIVLTGYKDGILTINDPFSKEKSKMSWTYERIEPQIRGLWSYSL